MPGEGKGALGSQGVSVAFRLERDGRDVKAHIRFLPISGNPDVQARPVALPIRLSGGPGDVREG
jgi:hypothetical protein